MTYKNYWHRFSAVIVFTAACSLSACNSSNDNAKPSGDDDAGSDTGGKTASGGKSGSSGKGGTSGKGGAGGSGGSGSGGSGGSGGSASGGKGGSGGSDMDIDGGEATGGTGGGGSGMACVKDSGKKCYTCEVDAPKSDDEFLNRCSEANATCSGYDNSKLSKIQNGKLPDLP